MVSLNVEVEGGVPGVQKLNSADADSESECLPSGLTTPSRSRRQGAPFAFTGAKRTPLTEEAHGLGAGFC